MLKNIALMLIGFLVIIWISIFLAPDFIFGLLAGLSGYDLGVAISLSTIVIAGIPILVLVLLIAHILGRRTKKTITNYLIVILAVIGVVVGLGLFLPFFVEMPSIGF